MALAAAAQPQVTWLERQHDFGVFLEADGKVTCSMALVNTGTEPLIIVKAQAGCGCTGITYPEEAIQPGDTASVSISYNPSGRPGQFSKEVLIFTNTVPKRTTLEITGNVIPTAATLDKQYPLQAGSLRISQQSVPFGELTKGQNKTLYLSAYNASTDTILVKVTGAKPHLRPALVPDTVPPAKVTALTVHYLTGHAPLWGLNVDTLTLDVKPLRQPSQATAGTASVLVMAQVLEDFSDLTKLEDMTPIFTETLEVDPTMSWHEHTCDLSAYAGKTVKLAFRHHDCVGQYLLKIDDAFVYTMEKWNGITTDINAKSTSNDVVRREYFNAAGQRVERPVNGINVVRQTMKDGSVKSVKFMMR